MAVYNAGLNFGYTLRLEVNLRSQDIAGNASIVDWSLYISKGAGTGRTAGGPNYWSKTINGAYSDGNAGGYDFTATSTWVLASGSRTIAHNADGTKTISVSGGYADGPYGDLGGATASGSFELPTIARATTATWDTPGNALAGVAKLLDLPRASSSFTHTVVWIVGAQSGTVGTGLTTSVNVTIPLAALSEMPSSTTRTGILRTTTYSGATVIGTKDSAFTLEAPSTVIPDFTTISHAEAVAAVSSQVGAYVKGLSKLTLGIGGAVGAYGSTITAYKLVVAGQTINAASGTTPAVINASGTVTITGTVTDSRGRSVSKTVNVTVLNWAPPAIDQGLLLVRRSDVAGTVDENGTTIRVDLTAAVSSLVNGSQKNALTYKIYTRKRGFTTWTLAANVTPGGISFAGIRLVSTYAISDSWEVRVDVSDIFATSSIATTVATSAVFMHWGTGLGVGKFWERGALDVGGQIYQNDGEKVVGESGWTNWVPTWTNLTLGNGSVGAQYLRRGSSVLITVRLTFGSTTTVSGVFYPSMPPVVASSPAFTGSAWAFDASATAWATGVFVPGNYFLMPQRATATVPFTFATGDVLQFQIELPAA